MDKASALMVSKELGSQEFTAGIIQIVIMESWAIPTKGFMATITLVVILV